MDTAITQTTSLTPVFIPSEQQSDFFAWVKDGRGNCVLEAVAGAGKSTTLLRAIEQMTGSIYLGAFNRAIAKELREKAEELKIARRGLMISTMHGAGFSAWKRKYVEVEVNENKVRDILEHAAQRKPELLDIQTFLQRLVSFAKQLLLPVHVDSAEAMSRWLATVDHFGLDEYLPEDVEVERAIKAASWVLAKSNSYCKSQIDFDDMIYAPVMEGLRMFQNDWVLLDEAQDTNPARRALARMMLKPRGRLVAVGDEWQAIYGFCHPAGTKVLTPEGYRNIEDLAAGDAHISVNTSGDVAGWKGSYRIQAITQHKGWDYILEVEAGGRSVRVTPHHRFPVKVDPGAQYLVYMMERQGKYRVGYMAAYTNGGDTSKGVKRSMLSQRCILEGTDKAWVLSAHATVHEAIIREAELHAKGAFGGSFTYLTPMQIDEMEQDTNFYHDLLRSHGRHPHFPLWVAGRRHHFEANVPFITEACNILPGMRIQVLGEWDDRVKGRSRHTGGWLPAEVIRHPHDPETPTYGITVSPYAPRDGYQPWPLYVADGIIVHNTGADSDALGLIRRDFKTINMPLTTTYRCPKAVVNYVHQWVSHIQAHESAPEGCVREPHRPEGMENKPWFVCEPPPADAAILCRLNAPLIQTAYGLLREGHACRVEGRDIGKGLIALAKRWKVRTLDALETKLESYLAK